MLDYLFNRKLRENYQKVLTLQNANEINDFLSQLCESERKDLLSFAIGWAVPNRKRTGAPICEYFLVHIMEFISPKDEKAYRNMDKVMTFISVLTAVGLLSLYMLHIL
jgi:hypothetical protein